MRHNSMDHRCLNLIQFKNADHERFERGLKVFKYDPCEQFLDDGEEVVYPFIPSMIRNALFAHARKTLNILTLRAGDRRRTLIGDLCKFEVLSVLETDWSLIVAGKDSWPNSLSDILPPSTEVLRLHTDHSFRTRYASPQVFYLLTTNYFPRLAGLHFLHLKPDAQVLMQTRHLQEALRRKIDLVLDTTPDPDLTSDPQTPPYSYF